MKAPLSQTIAVLTGDLVQSSTLSPSALEEAFDALQRCAALQESWVGDSLRFTRHRGDGWQVALPTPQFALRAALAFRAHLRALGDTNGAPIDSYIGIATGPALGDLGSDPGRDLNGRSDMVFVVSGRALDRIKSDKDATKGPPAYLRLASPQPSLRAVTILVDYMSRGWTPAQAEVCARMLAPAPPSYTDLAKAVGKSRQAVTKSLTAAGWFELAAALALVEEEMDNV
ncbi:hypothetical protein AQS8620_01770 [Aquimixticola soesokkakensis]|uniref:Uncharacterized protein n=1 Tax=Aquimixticola soesokkakensis TaxID=1519096 RepID=A0A1Y5SMN8_9RHOB|nr:hypothetical protein [Aquimixticola soesokkakensis]SLN44246.1 hypothetical protein AQS8620_01770 [Aquimixticola soesokkakensis]